MWHLYALRLIFLKDIGKHKTMYLGSSFPLSDEWEQEQVALQEREESIFLQVQTSIRKQVYNRKDQLERSHFWKYFSIAVNI